MIENTFREANLIGFRHFFESVQSFDSSRFYEKIDGILFKDPQNFPTIGHQNCCDEKYEWEIEMIFLYGVNGTRR